MKADVVLGLQWGDEGKGKIVDVLSSQYQAVARYHGGSNAGHTLEFDGQKIVLSVLPSGIVKKEIHNVIGSGVVLDVMTLRHELEVLESSGYRVSDWQNLSISKKAHLILPTHRLLDRLAEERLGERKIGSTQKGIAPAYADKVLRKGIRVADVLQPNFEVRCRKLMEEHRNQLPQTMAKEIDLEAYYQEFMESIRVLQKFPLIDTELVLNDILNKGGSILAEGAQATLLDLDHGSYPFVTSSNALSGGACVGLGIAPHKIGDVYGVFKAYCTRVGNGPFPTEMEGESAALLRTVGNEFGAVTKRSRRTGWLDLPTLKYAIMLNGVTKLIITKVDVLSAMETIQLCTHYLVEGKRVDHASTLVESDAIVPVFKEFKSWGDVGSAREESQLPTALIDYIAFLEEALMVPIAYISVGPDRAQMVKRACFDHF
ncbi:adenylosuccinate synthase [Olivibacter sp. CPCC 100613]|uniref:adenylosuccinate synthase n=1 Tax=Olivibacter sp. CPCC 100613 TaxID=3079931 RepID=UPI002FF69434